MNKTLLEAREWINTPWRAGQSKKGVSCDCVGLVVGVGRNLGLDLNIENYSQVPKGDSLIQEISKHGKRIELSEALPGDVAVFKLSLEGLPSHVGFLSESGTLIHADARSRIRRVVEVPLGYWRRRLVATFRLPLL